MDPLLPARFSPYYPPDDPEDVLPLEQDVLVFVWLDSLTGPGLSHSSLDSASTGYGSSNIGVRSSLPLADPLHSHSDDNGHASSEESSSSSSSSECRRGKKARVSLDPCQPLTVKGKPRARVYVACRECRNRKVRCDGAKPVCFNCSKRDPTVEACDYDPAPKRRGQDKVPGTRIRSAIGQRAPRRTLAVDNHSHANGQQQANVHDAGVNPEVIIQDFDPTTFDPTNIASYELPPPPPSDPAEDEQDASGREQERLAGDLMVVEPSMQFARETWWDALLVFYASHDVDGDLGAIMLTAEQRLTTTKRVFTDIRAVLSASFFWASFLHLPRFFETLLDPARRNAVQPSLLLSMLAIGAHVQSSEVMQGAKGRERAQKLIDLAHSAIQASLSTNWVDIGLVQAAWFMAYFEMQGHPRQQWDRCRSATQLLDSLIRLLSLTTLDADRPDAHYAIFATYARSVRGSMGPRFNDHTGTNAHPHPFSPPEGNSPSETVDIAGLGIQVPGPARGFAAQCTCAKYTLKEQWPTVSEVAPLWEMTTMWPDGLLEGEFRKEECRRLVWSSVMLIAGQNAFTSADAAALGRTELFIKDYRNYAVLLPGEDSGKGPVWQSSVWNLCLRAMMLWNTSVRQRGDATLSPQARAEYAMNAWLEAEAIEAALDQHTCHLDAGMLYQAREYVFISRMCITHEFRLYAPEVTSLGIMSYYREKAEAWLRTQVWISERFWKAAQEDVKCEMMTRPPLCYWFMAQIVRALVLYKSDLTLLVALDAAKVHVKPLEFLMRIWPCDEQRQMWSLLRRELVQTCVKAGVAPPDSAVPAPFEGVVRKLHTSMAAPQT
ncbi:hypothetical protein LXA43DRAFT_1168655 [Ganoderma leucocontextum]|nr:hypothetical protein LXA43DRAFT_1168655 [Ganoderma leucocontextum]